MHGGPVGILQRRHAVNADEARWWRRFKRVIRDMPDGLVVVTTATGSITVHRRVEGSHDNEHAPLTHMRGEHRVYPCSEKMR